jgi:hypothetical protein
VCRLGVMPTDGGVLVCVWRGRAIRGQRAQRRGQLGHQVRPRRAIDHSDSDDDMIMMMIMMIMTMRMTSGMVV